MAGEGGGGRAAITSAEVRRLARQCGFELAGVARAEACADAARYSAWLRAGFAGAMSYLEGRRAEVRADPHLLLPSARSVICVGKLYNTPWPYSVRYGAGELAWISRYAWGDDYHAVMRRGLKRLAASLAERHGEAFDWKVGVDTAPLLERSYARLSGLGWIGKNTCVIREGFGSWFFIGALLVSLAIEPEAPPPDRCGSCTRCIDACPTAAIRPAPSGSGYAVDSRLCISYFTIELRDSAPAGLRGEIGGHVFGCDICQDVCPWKRKAPVTEEPSFQPRLAAPLLAEFAGLGESEFRAMFHGSPVSRARYTGFLRNVAVAMGNRGLPEFREPLEKLAASPDELVAENARWALSRLPGS